jgi:hypothetical protein
MCSLWNPYAAALVPEKLRLEVSGLPKAIRFENTSTNITDAIVQLDQVYGSPLSISLPWDSSDNAEDHQSWLPGRVYTWASLPDTNTAPPPDGFESKFDTRDLNATATKVAVDRVISSATINGKDDYQLAATDKTTLTLKLWAVRPDGDVLLKTFTSPEFESFVTDIDRLSKDTWQIAFLFRLAEGIDTPDAPETWLLGPRRDPRRSSLRAAAFIAGPNGPRPELYPNWVTIEDTTRVLSREGASFDEDVPVFELPRSPILSLGMLQHLARSRGRSFGIGNSWGTFGQVNNLPTAEIFDRFFFSGLAAGVAPTGTDTKDLILPNVLLKPLRKSDGSKVSAQEIRDFASPTTTTDPDGNVIVTSPGSARSSKYFLQAGAFNLNSTNPTAWAAVLRSVRFPAPTSFTFLAPLSPSSTAADSATSSVQSDDAQFFRFSQSAQETYQIGTDDVSIAGTKNYRRGMRSLDSSQITMLSQRIVGLIGARHSVLGPFRSLEEFLQPLPDTIVADQEEDATADDVSIASTFGHSLLERAIAEAGINAGIEFSSQYLTQADVMTALAPVLFARSDTFIIRAYGEAVNPTTTNVEGKAWCEAVVQRLPEFFADPANTPADTPLSSFEPAVNPDTPDAGATSTEAQQLNKLYGRRFKIVSFRWLTRSDI